MSAYGLAPLVNEFRDGGNDPERTLERCLIAAEVARDDKALLCRVATAAQDAEAARRRMRAGKLLGPLDGVPVVVKDCIHVAGERTTIGTQFLRRPSRNDAEIVRRLRNAGAVVFAKANMHEFGIQPTGVNPHHGTPVNPWAPDRIPGGSSSGSAVSVASGIAPVAIGTDAGGSIRVPAAINGLVGLKPTFGVVPDEGVMKLTEDLDHVGPLGWTVEDVTAVFEVLAGRQLDRAAPIGKVALLADFFEGAQESVIQAVTRAAAEVFGTCPMVQTPLCAWASAVEFVIVGASASKVLSTYMELYAAYMGKDTLTILQLGGAMPEADRNRARRVRAGMREELAKLLQQYDVLIGPTLGSEAPKLDPIAARSGELDTLGIARLAATTFPANLTGLPSCTVPCVREGQPVGMQIIGRPNDEARVLAAARAVEKAFGPRRPPRWYGQP